MGQKTLSWAWWITFLVSCLGWVLQRSDDHVRELYTMVGKPRLLSQMHEQISLNTTRFALRESTATVRFWPKAACQYWGTSPHPRPSVASPTLQSPPNLPITLLTACLPLHHHSIESTT